MPKFNSVLTLTVVVMVSLSCQKSLNFSVNHSSKAYFVVGGTTEFYFVNLLTDSLMIHYELPDSRKEEAPKTRNDLKRMIKNNKVNISGYSDTVKVIYRKMNTDPIIYILEDNKTKYGGEIKGLILNNDLFLIHPKFIRGMVIENDSLMLERKRMEKDHFQLTHYNFILKVE